MSSRWTHNICAACWNAKNPDREAHAAHNMPAEFCCFCGKPTTAGIYLRHDPKDPSLKCDAGKDHEDD
jgi:hypothetical protein